MIIYCADCGHKNEYSGAIKPKRCFSCDEFFDKQMITNFSKKPSIKVNAQETEDEELSLAFNLNPKSIKISVDEKMKFEQINGGGSQVTRNENRTRDEDIAEMLNKIAK